MLNTRTIPNRYNTTKPAVKRKHNILNYIDTLDLKIKIFKSKQDLYKAALKEYNDYNNYTNKKTKLKYKSCDESFLKRISINYLRHTCTNYEDQLVNMFNNDKNKRGYNKLKTKVNDKIYETYPFLFEPSEEEASTNGRDLQSYIN